MFKLLQTDGVARRGELITAHGTVQTPAFMPVGTRATVRTLDQADLHQLDAEIILGNTYHLNLRPGTEIIREAGGLHPFMNWQGPILTDSGGFQVFSLAKSSKIGDDGVTFQSHIDGAPMFLGPREAMSIQHDLGSDIAMVFDDCPPATATKEEVKTSLARTHRWAAECRHQPRAEGQLVFGSNQGGGLEDLREQSAEALVPMDFDGYAIGGLSVGEPEPDMLRIAGHTAPLLPKDKPRYAMGLGTPAQLIELIARGVEMFDWPETAPPTHSTVRLPSKALSIRPISPPSKRIAIVTPAGTTRGHTCGICLMLAKFLSYDYFKSTTYDAISY